MKLNSSLKKGVVYGLTAALLLSLTADAQSRRRSKEAKQDKEDTQQSFYFMDSTEGQWGRRSVNDSVYRNIPVNAVYLERGRRRLPDSFKMYKAKPINEQNLTGTSAEPTPTTITVNGKVQKLPDNQE